MTVLVFGALLVLIQVAVNLKGVRGWDATSSRLVFLTITATLVAFVATEVVM